MGFREWWERQPMWLRYLLYGLCMLVLGVMSQFVIPGFSWIYSVIKVQGLIIVLTILIPLLAMAILTTKYIVDVIGRKLDNITSILIKIAEKLGVEAGERVQSPGYIYTACRWLRISREYVDGKGTRHIYVYCVHIRETQ